MVEPRRIVVTSDCQTAGISAALSLLLPDDTIVPAPISSTEAGLESLARTVADSAVWITTHPNRQVAQSTGAVIGIPRLRFGFFHPDMGYLTDKNGRNIQNVDCAYHSMIIAACWISGWGPDDACRLFSEATFERLGYFGIWGMENDSMQAAFGKCGLDYGSFLSAVNRNNPFMFTRNHPKQIALTEVAQQVAGRLGAPLRQSFPELNDILRESLDSVVWPVYPDIGRRYGVRGHYRWRVRLRIIDGLSSYIRESFIRYEELGLSFAQLSEPSQQTLLKIRSAIGKEPR